MYLFKESLKKGRIGEMAFYNANKVYLEDKSNERGSDFIVKRTGERIECKSDFYHTSNNIVAERYSKDSIIPKPNGGPWQALDHESDFYVYQYLNDKNEIVNTYYFNTKNLVEKIEELVRSLDLELRRIPNKDRYGKFIYNTECYIFPIVLLEDLFLTKWHMFRRG